MSSHDGLFKGAMVVGAGLAGYLVLALVMSSAAEPLNVRLPAKEPINLDFGPHERRQDEVLLHKAGFAYECVECHAWQRRDPEPRRFIGEHVAMNLEHGSVVTCFTCHHPTEYSALTMPSGEVIPFNDHIKLCAGCHGPIYKDWRNGAHGRREGYWDRESGPVSRTDCIICHDPHQPAFKPIAPLAPPGVARGKAFAPPDEASTVLGQVLKYVPPPPPPERAPARREEIEP
jgi:hypothetical protein